MIRMLLVGYCYGIRHERRLCQEVALHLAYCRFASRMTSPSARQGSLPAGWLAFAGRELNPLDRNERFQATCSSPFPGLTLTLHPPPLIHVLPKGLHRIRHYGLLAKGVCADNIARVRELLVAVNAQSRPTRAAADSSKPSCPCCGGRMIIIEVFERGATPLHRPTAPTSIRIDTS
jgi:hypothetical protein